MYDTNLQVEYVSTDELQEYKNNSKLHPSSQINQIASSIEEFGFNSPILAWHNDDGEPEIVAGHGRLMAARNLGLRELPVVFLDHMTEEQRRAYILVDNQLTMNSGFDGEVLKSELDKIFDIDMSQFDFDIEIDDIEFNEDNEPEIPENVPSIVKEGEVWQLGSHKLMCGSSTNKDCVKTLLGGKLADLLLTDPPYGVSYIGKTEDGLTIENDSMNDEEFYNFLHKAFSIAEENMKKGSSYYVFHADSRGHIFRQAIIDSGLEIRECLVWVKNALVLGRQDYHWRHEPCLYGWKGGAAHSWYSDRKQSTVLEFDKPNASREHPTMKPVSLIAYLISNSTKKQDVVLDIFGGSGSTLMACEQLGRECRIMELDPHYCDVIIARWEELTGQKAIKEL